MKYPSVSLKVIAGFLNRLEASEKQTTCFSTEKVETHIALYLAESLDQEDTGTVELTLSMNKKDLASYLGTTPETISRKFNDLEEQGYIKRIKINELP